MEICSQIHVSIDRKSYDGALRILGQKICPRKKKRRPLGSVFVTKSCFVAKTGVVALRLRE